MAGKLYLINLHGDWFLARTAEARNFSEPRDPPHGLGIPADALVWSEHRTTAFLGRVGEEASSKLLAEKS